MMIGLDIGTDVIRACLFEGTFGRYTFSKTLEEHVPRSYLDLGFPMDSDDDDTEEVDPAVLAQADLERRQSGAIHAMLRKFPKCGCRHTSAGNTGQSPNGHAPFTDSKLIAALPSTVEEIVPFDLDDFKSNIKY